MLSWREPQMSIKRCAHWWLLFSPRRWFISIFLLFLLNPFFSSSVVISFDSFSFSFSVSIYLFIIFRLFHLSPTRIRWSPRWVAPVCWIRGFYVLLVNIFEWRVMWWEIENIFFLKSIYFYFLCSTRHWY